jgi:hypothetical protein
MKGDMKEVKQRLTNVEDRLTNVEKDLAIVKQELAIVKEDLANVKELAEFNKETSQSIMNVVTSHYMEFKKYVKQNNVQHKVYDAKLLQFNKEN